MAMIGWQLQSALLISYNSVVTVIVTVIITVLV